MLSYTVPSTTPSFSPALLVVPPLPVGIAVLDGNLSASVRAGLAGVAGVGPFDATGGDGLRRLIENECTVGVVHFDGLLAEFRMRLTGSVARRCIALTLPSDAESVPSGCFDVCAWPTEQTRLPLAVDHLRERLQLLTRVAELERRLRDLAPGGYDDVVPFDQVEKAAILHALRATRGNIRDAAKLLGLGQATVYRKIKRYGVDRTARLRVGHSLSAAIPDNSPCV